ncbi:GTPase Ras2p [Histoplasma capsulatum var. duboisii H88]|uniref:GTPase Ras2p n=1 Tax=Ajellomyces capsulatus (strain H88) TaxID=544711 RepID=F0UAF1_AJEC8|nr:GTPase Ras2p [Histoplasma capsulatum var. duboisii H88]QSS49061.1 GTPase Ras2p [Histoplasma capsulatum var. duboisii H88]
MAETVSITICGDGGCGKSSITLRLVRSQWTHEYDPTIEDSYSVTRTVDGVPYFLALTDTAGQEEYRGLWASSNLKSDAFLLVYDITNASTLEALDYFVDMIDIEAEQRLETNARLIKELGPLRHPGEQVAVGMAPPVRIVAGNKCDLKDARVVSARQGLEYARRKGCGFMETSAREMVNIEETFALIIRRVVEARYLHHRQQFPAQPQTPGYSSLEAHSLPQSLFSPDLILTSQADFHSRTPALTAKEREITDNNINDQTTGNSTQKPNQWQGLGRAISKRVRKVKHRDTADPGHKSPPSTAHREKSISETTELPRNNPPQPSGKREDDGTEVAKVEVYANKRCEPGENQRSLWRWLFCRNR